jgi:small subunit ribosomal protein S17
MPRRVMQGVVVKDAKDKTISVLVERSVKHPVYKKYIKRSKKFLAHDEGNRSRQGDLVSIVESRPLSKRKTWILIDDAGSADQGASS